MSYEIFSGRFIMQWNFGLHNDLIMAKKMTFFRIFFFSCTSSHRGATFLFLSKFHIFSRSEKSWGDKKKALHRRTNERTNDERTTLTTIIPRQDSENPRANLVFRLPLLGFSIFIDKRDRSQFSL